MKPCSIEIMKIVPRPLTAFDKKRSLDLKRLKNGPFPRYTKINRDKYETLQPWETYD
jgi:hypothetical protein